MEDERRKPKLIRSLSLTARLVYLHLNYIEGFTIKQVLKECQLSNYDKNVGTFERTCFNKIGKLNIGQNKESKIHLFGYQMVIHEYSCWDGFLL